MSDLSAFQVGLPRSTQLSIICAQAASFDEFVCAVYEMLDMAARRIEESAHLSFESGSVEDGLTSRITDILLGLGLKAKATSMSGNTDLTIENHDLRFNIICEAKVFGGTGGYGNNHIFEGVLQLCSRYTTVAPEHDHCALIVFNFKPKTKQVMDAWREYFFRKSSEQRYKERFENLSDFVYSDYQGSRGFFTSHIHYTSGEPVRIRHIPVSLFFDPIDKSGRNSQ